MRRSATSLSLPTGRPSSPRAPRSAWRSWWRGCCCSPSGLATGWAGGSVPPAVQEEAGGRCRSGCRRKSGTGFVDRLVQRQADDLARHQFAAGEVGEVIPSPGGAGAQTVGRAQLVDAEAEGNLEFDVAGGGRIGQRNTIGVGGEGSLGTLDLQLARYQPDLRPGRNGLIRRQRRVIQQDLCR